VSGPITAYRAKPYSYTEARTLVQELGVSEPIAITLVRRGYRTPEEAQAFLAADESYEPDRFESMGIVVERVLAAVRGGERITVYGDFDVDGVCATTILVSALRELGADADWLIPDRAGEGYGISAANIERLAERGTKLLVSVDCGITSVEEVALARSLGMDVIVTDHHEPAAELPDCPILHPTVDGYPFPGLCGTGVSWKLACALRTAASEDSPASQSGEAGGSEKSGEAPEAAALAAANDADLDLVALATVADMVPLIGENRFLVRRGLEEVRRARRPGIRALLEVAYCERSQLDEGDLSFRLAPRINAAGRLYRADAGVELFLTEDEDRAAEIAKELNRANNERRGTEQKVEKGAEGALRRLPEQLRRAHGFVVAGEGWHPGVIGIVASRMVERHHRPMVVVALDGEGGGRGSGRSIPGFDLLAALEQCSEHLERFGGHRAAAGLELRAENLEAFQRAFAAHANSVLGPEDLQRTEQIDAMVGGAGLGLELAEELGQLAPFGLGNPAVRLLVPGAHITDVRPMGKGKHARFNLHSGAHRALGVAFGRSSLGVREEESVDAAVKLEINHWNGSVEPRIVLRELYPHRGSPGEEEDELSGSWRSEFEAELLADPAAWPPQAPGAEDKGRRRAERGSSSPAAAIAELASSGEEVLAVVADTWRRSHFANLGAHLADPETFVADPDLACRFEHVVLVDPPCFPHLDRLAARPCGGGGYLHLVWGEGEWRISHAALSTRYAQRRELIAVFRELREAGPLNADQLRKTLRGGDKQPRNPRGAARCLRVLSELGLLEGDENLAAGVTGVVSSQRTDLERSAAFRAYGARYQEGHKYLESRRQS
jgi:single-stranded-DNA-specific exonuclease